MRYLGLTIIASMLFLSPFFTPLGILAILGAAVLCGVYVPTLILALLLDVFFTSGFTYETGGFLFPWILLFVVLHYIIRRYILLIV